MEQKINKKELYIPIKVTTRQKTLNDVDDHLNMRYQQYQKKILMDYFEKKVVQTEVSPSKLNFNILPAAKKNENTNRNKDFKPKELNILNNQKIHYYQLQPISNPISTKKDRKFIFPPFIDNNQQKKEKDEFFLPNIIRGENNQQKIKHERLYHSIDYDSERSDYNKYTRNREAKRIYERIEIPENICESFTTLTSINSISDIDHIMAEKENTRVSISDRTIENAVQYHLKQASKNIRKIKNNFKFRKDEKYLFQINT